MGANDVASRISATEHVEETVYVLKRVCIKSICVVAHYFIQGVPLLYKNWIIHNLATVL